MKTAFRIAAPCYGLILLIGYLLPKETAEATGAYGLPVHFAAFAVLNALAVAAFARSPGPVFAWSALSIAYGACLETLQLLVPGRAFEWMDILMNTAGALAVLPVALYWLKRDD